jgi:signal transduction histidine kinase
LALATAVGAIELLGTAWAAQSQPERRELDLLGVGLLALGSALLLLRSRWPVAVLSTVALSTLAYTLLQYPRGPIYLAMIVALFTAILAGRRLAAWTILVCGYFAFSFLPVLLRIEPPPQAPAAIGLAGWMLLLGVAVEFVRVRREETAAALRSREEEALRKASEERERLARDVHDVLAHSLSVINIQAGVALHLLEERPEQARPALSVIKEVSKDALHELRSVLDQHSTRTASPSPSLSRLDDLVATAAAGGVQVQTEVCGSLDGLPPGVDLAAFRILQEAVTNVIRHASSGTATLRVERAEHELTLQVDDNGPKQPTSDGTGRGLLGMRERAAALAGSFEAGPRPEGGFRVLVHLPL